MNKTTKRLLPFLLAVLLVVSIILPVDAAPASEKIFTTPSGYTKASDVDYKTFNGIIANWGARGEDCVFLTTYASGFYPSGSTYAELSQLDGSSQLEQVPNSELYQALQELMVSNHTFFTKYSSGDEKTDSRDLYQYTDSMLGDPSLVSTIYRGEICTGPWVSGSYPYNQEHVWPQKKLDKSNSKEVGDIMHLRPCIYEENSSRGNDCYGENSGSGYYDPGVSVRGDCARMTLYMYVRWEKTDTMWGKSGVIESLDILLKWMEEDPVDTWEMGRNDSVQSITGTRNVFVDYPELAWLLFDQEVPADMTTPSAGKGSGTPPVNNNPPAGNNPPVDNNPPAGNNPPVDNNPPAGNNPSTPTECKHARTKLVNQKAATCTEAGYTGDKLCSQCNKKLEAGTAIPAGHKDADQNSVCDVCNTSLCTHPETQLKNEKVATCQEEGYTGDKICTACGHIIEKGSTLPKGDHRPTVTGQAVATCGKDGYSGDTVCGDCNEPIIDGTPIPATGNHSYGDWVTDKEATTKETGLQTRTCTECGHKESQELPVLAPSYTWVIVTVVAVAAVGTAVAVYFILKRKKQ